MDNKQQAINTDTPNKSTKINGLVYFINIRVNGHVIPVYKKHKRTRYNTRLLHLLIWCVFYPMEKHT